MGIKLIIGIGNPDEQYKNTRHNVGFMMADYIAKKNDFGDFELNKGLESLVSKGKIGESKIILAKPQTYVNKSGLAIKKLAVNCKLKTENSNLGYSGGNNIGA